MLAREELIWSRKQPLIYLKLEGRRWPSEGGSNSSAVAFEASIFCFCWSGICAPFLLTNASHFSLRESLQGRHVTQAWPVSAERASPAIGKPGPLALTSIGPGTSAAARGKGHLPLHWVVSWQQASLALSTVKSAPGFSPA